MKRLLACATLALLPGVAAADWEPIGTTELHLQSIGGKMTLFVSKDGNAGFGIPAKEMCSQHYDELKTQEYAGDLEINGKLVKFDRKCRLGKLVLYASTAKGAEYLSGLVFDNTEITVSSNNNAIASFKNRGLQEAMKKINRSPAI